MRRERHQAARTRNLGVSSTGAQGRDLVHLEGIARVAALAGDAALLALRRQLADILLRHGAQDPLNPLARAAAARLQRVRREDADPVLVEEAEQELVRRQ